MKLHIKISTAFCLIILFLMSCKNKPINSNQQAEEIFSLNTTSCMGPCPVFELSIYGDKTLFFKGEENTSLKGEHKKTLTDEQFEALLGIIESADWANLDDTYKSNMLDLPTQNFSYNRNGLKKKVSRYGDAPESISTMSDTILTFVENQVFNE